MREKQAALVRSMEFLCKFMYIYLSVCQSGSGGPCTMCKHNPLIEVQYNDGNTNVTDSMKLCNTKLHVFSHYFCCTIP